MKRWMFALALVASGAHADTPPQTLGLDDYLALVGQRNLDLAAQRYNVPIAQAQVTVAKLFPEPQLSGGIDSIDIRFSGAPTTYGLGLSQEIELGGKRKNRIRSAEHAVTGAKDDLEDFVRNLRGQAADAYVDAIAARLVLDRKQATFDKLTQLVQRNEDSRRAGNIGDLPVIQSKVEADKFKGDLLAAAGDVRRADIALGQLVGTSQPLAPKGDLNIAPRTFDAAKLIADAKLHRPDVQSARAAVAAAEAKIDLAHSNIAIDPTFSLGWSHATATNNSESYGVIAPSPAADFLTATVAIPLPFARRKFKGELEAATATHGQAEQQLKVAELKVEVEIQQALATYAAAIDRVKLYESGILTNAEKVLDETSYNFTRGSGTQLEVLDAARTLDEVYLDYYQALADHAHALIAVEQAAGIWDVKL
ncbi:MAG TPA: TolC family protein [Kofleriaceae bacterium]|nr:TolC family protein [Kofleriaceae bacterium]